MMTNIVGVDPETVTVGQAVQVVFEPAGDGDAIPRFTPTSEPVDQVRAPGRGLEPP